nr:ABC transporter permease [Erwinia sp. S38]
MAGRLLQALGTLWLLSAIVFFALSMMKGDAATSRLAGNADRQQVEIVRVQLGLDRPLAERYANWLSGILRGDWGHSYLNNRPVSQLLWDRGRYSLALGGVASVLLLLLTFFCGTWCGLHPGRGFDRACGLLSLIFVALPEFVTGTLLVLIFSLTLHWLPALSLISPAQSLWRQWPQFILPVLTLLSVCLAQNIKLMRLGVLRASRSSACENARLNGISERQVIVRWILPQALGNTLPVLARYITYLSGGALVAETLFGWPGLAASLLNATLLRDTPVVMGIAMVICAVTVLLNGIADLLTAMLNPAARRGGEGG